MAERSAMDQQSLIWHAWLVNYVLHLNDTLSQLEIIHTSQTAI